MKNNDKESPFLPHSHSFDNEQEKDSFTKSKTKEKKYLIQIYFNSRNSSNLPSSNQSITDTIIDDNTDTTDNNNRNGNGNSNQSHYDNDKKQSFPPPSPSSLVNSDISNEATLSRSIPPSQSQSLSPPTSSSNSNFTKPFTLSNGGTIESLPTPSINKIVESVNNFPSPPSAFNLASNNPPLTTTLQNNPNPANGINSRNINNPAISPPTSHNHQVKSEIGAQIIPNGNATFPPSTPLISNSSPFPSAFQSPSPSSPSSSSSLSPHHIQQIKSQIHSQQNQNTFQSKNSILQATLLAKVPPFKPEWVNEQVFLDSLNKFHLILHKVPLRKIPIIGDKTLSLLSLFKLVIGNGGFKIVYYQKKWPLIASSLGFSNYNSELLTAIYTIYFNILWTYEQWMIRRIPVDQLERPQPLSHFTSSSSPPSALSSIPSNFGISNQNSTLNSSLITAHSLLNSNSNSNPTLTGSSLIPQVAPSQSSLNQSHSSSSSSSVSAMNMINSPFESTENGIHGNIGASSSFSPQQYRHQNGKNPNPNPNVQTGNVNEAIISSGSNRLAPPLSFNLSNPPIASNPSVSTINSNLNSNSSSFKSGKKRKLLLSILDLDFNQIKGLNLKRILIHNPELLGSIQYDNVIGLLLSPPTIIKGLNILLAMSFLGISPTPLQLGTIVEIMKKYLYYNQSSPPPFKPSLSMNSNNRGNEENSESNSKSINNSFSFISFIPSCNRYLWKLTNIKTDRENCLALLNNNSNNHEIIQKNNNTINNENISHYNHHDQCELLQITCIVIIRNWSLMNFNVARDLCQNSTIIEWLRNFSYFKSQHQLQSQYQSQSDFHLYSSPSLFKDILVIRDNISHLISGSIRETIFPDLIECLIDVMARTIKSYRSYFYTNIFLSLMLPEDFISNSNSNSNSHNNQNASMNERDNKSSNSASISNTTDKNDEIDKKGWNKFNYIIHNWFKIFPPKLVLLFTIFLKEIIKNGNVNNNIDNLIENINKNNIGNHERLMDSSFSFLNSIDSLLLKSLVNVIQELSCIFLSMIICGSRITCLIIKKYQLMIENLISQSNIANSTSASSNFNFHSIQKNVKLLSSIVHNHLHCFADFGIMEITFNIISFLSFVKPDIFIFDSDLNLDSNSCNQKEKNEIDQKEKNEKRNLNTKFISTIFQSLVEVRRIWQSFNDSLYKFEFETIPININSRQSSSQSSSFNSSIGNQSNKNIHSSNDRLDSMNRQGKINRNSSPLVYDSHGNPSIGSNFYELFKRLLEITRNLSLVPSCCKILMEMDAVEIISQWLIVNEDCLARTSKELISCSIHLEIYNEILCNLLANSI